MNNQEANDDSIIIEDLSTQYSEEIKGGSGITKLGSRRLIIQSDAAYGQQDGETASFNHNETVSEDNEADTKSLTDLTLNDETEAGIKGGLLVPAVQAAREASASAVGSSGMSAGKVSYSDLH